MEVFQKRRGPVQPEPFDPFDRRVEHHSRRGALQLDGWDTIARTVARYDFNALQRVVTWPIREVLVAYVEHLHQRAAHAYEQDISNFTVIAVNSSKKLDPPEMPELLTSYK